MSDPSQGEIAVQKAEAIRVSNNEIKDKLIIINEDLKHRFNFLLKTIGECVIFNNDDDGGDDDDGGRAGTPPPTPAGRTDECPVTADEYRRLISKLELVQTVLRETQTGPLSEIESLSTSRNTDRLSDLVGLDRPPSNRTFPGRNITRPPDNTRTSAPPLGNRYGTGSSSAAGRGRVVSSSPVAGRGRAIARALQNFPRAPGPPPPAAGQPPAAAGPAQVPPPVPPPPARFRGGSKKRRKKTRRKRRTKRAKK